jgi:mono/diheme cytochrome c family protein
MTDRPNSIASMKPKLPRLGWMLSLLVMFILLFAACQPSAPAPAASPTEAAPAATEAPEATEEATEEPTEEPVEEAEATEEATEEPTEEEAEATEEPAEEASTTDEGLEAGAYLFTIARGCGCHFNSDLQALAGGNAFELPDGTVYAANITPHEETGIGSWSAEEVATVLRTGAEPDGDQLHPIMPYRDFSVLSDQDALSLAEYLLSQEPVENAVPERELASEPAAFTLDPASPAEAPTDPVARGEYLVKLARCSGCHTPNNEDGSPNMDLYLAGAPLDEDEVAWNITPDDETGIGTIPEEEIATFLRTGMLADGSQIVGTMATQIERYFSKLTVEDSLAIAAYLKSIPPISHDPEDTQ